MKTILEDGTTFVLEYAAVRNYNYSKDENARIRTGQQPKKS